MAVLVIFVGPSIIGPENLVGSNNVLTTARMIPLPVDGPESLDWDPQGGGPYVGVTDGRILKWSGEDLGWVEFAHASPDRFVCIILVICIFLGKMYNSHVTFSLVKKT